MDDPLGAFAVDVQAKEHQHEREHLFETRAAHKTKRARLAFDWPKFSCNDTSALSWPEVEEQKICNRSHIDVQTFLSRIALLAPKVQILQDASETTCNSPSFDRSTLLSQKVQEQEQLLTAVSHGWNGTTF